MASKARPAQRQRSTVAILDLHPTVAGRGAKGSQENSSSSGPSTSAFRRFGGMTLLEWSVRRLAESALIDEIAITGPGNIGPEVVGSQIGSAIWLPSDDLNAVKRAAYVAQETNAQWLVFTSTKCPFVDAVLLDRLIQAGWSNPDSDYVGFFSPTRPNFSLGGLGLVGELCHRRAIDRLASQAKNAVADRSVPTLVKIGSENFSSKLIPLPAALDAENLRFSLETPEDWEHADALLEFSREEADYRRLAAYSFQHAASQTRGPHLVAERLTNATR